MPTANISKALHEELLLLSHAIEGDTFHFALAQWNHFSLIQQTRDFLRQQYPERSALSLTVKGLSYETLTERIYEHAKGIVFIDDFENLLEDPALYVGFNQRRGKMARLPLSIICFIPPGERYLDLCIKRLPDWWSVLSFFAELKTTEEKTERQPEFQEQTEYTTTLGGTNQKGRLDEIARLKKRIAEIKLTAANAHLLDEQFKQLLQLLETSGQYQKGLEEANEWLKAALALDYEKNAPDTFSLILDRLGTFEQHLGHYDRAARLMEKALKIDLEHFGPAHPNVALRQSNLATVYKELGQYEKARDLLEAALASDLKNFGQEHPNVAVSQSNLANVYRNLGQYEKARDLLEAALASAVKNFGQEHPNVAVSQNNLAFVLKDMGEEKAAIQMMKKAYALRLKLLGPEHPYTKGSAQTLRNWGAEPEGE